MSQACYWTVSYEEPSTEKDEAIAAAMKAAGFTPDDPDDNDGDDEFGRTRTFRFGENLSEEPSQEAVDASVVDEEFVTHKLRNLDFDVVVDKADDY